MIRGWDHTSYAARTPAIYQRVGTGHNHHLTYMKTSVRLPLPPFFFAGILFLILGGATYLGGIGFSFVRLVFRLGEPYRSWNEDIIWYSGFPTTVGILLVALDLALFLPTKRRRSRRRALDPVASRRVTVALTAYNDESSIAQSVDDFRRHPCVDRVIVVDNNSRDGTFDAARRAGASVVRESRP